MSGIVYLIGAGPGDFKLITVKGRECIEKADVIVYDYLADETLLRWARPDAEIIYAGKQCRNHTLHQYEINELLVDRGLKGKVVARLKGGDPLVFGRGGEEALALEEAGVPFEFVPGVTSAISAPAYAGIPVTQRAMATSFAVVTGHEDPTKSVSGIHWEGLATAVDTLCFVMGIGNLPLISAKLMANGRSPQTPVAVIRWGTKSTQETLVSDLEHVADDVEKAGLKAPALIVVGDVVNLREKLRWFDNKPLFGRTIVVTRSQSKAGTFGDALRDLGANVIEAAAIKTAPLFLAAQTVKTVVNANAYKAIVFTSAEGVRYFFDVLRQEHKDARALGSAAVCAIGSATAKALENYGIYADVIPANFRSEAVVGALRPLLKDGDKVLLVQPKIARAVIHDGLTAAGIDVNVVRLYETVPDDSKRDTLREALANQSVDYITFTSSSTVTNTLGLLGAEGAQLIKKAKVVCIGPITAATCTEHGIVPDLISEVFTIPAMVDVILKDATN